MDTCGGSYGGRLRAIRPVGGDLVNARQRSARVLRVTFSRAQPAADYAEVARGTWQLGKDPVLSGEPIPPEVISGLEVQMRAVSTPAGTIFHDRADTRYAMEFAEMSS
jgi:hypothetical protein